MSKRKLFSFCIIFCLLAEPVSAAVAKGWKKHVIANQATPIYVYVKDIDKDGDLDIVSTTNRHPNVYNSEVAWFQNNLNKNKEWTKFIISSRAPDTSPLTNTNGIIVADFNGDGREDVAVATGRVTVNKGSVHWFKAPQDPAGKWEKFNIETDVENSYFKIYTIDTNKDGSLDLIVGGNQGAAVFVNPGQPDKAGVTWKKISIPDKPYKAGSSIFLDDINGDGKKDLINSCEGMAADTIGNVSWFDINFKGGKTTFARTMIDPGLEKAFDVNCMDVNGDKKKDVIVTAFQKHYVFWYEAPLTAGAAWKKHVVTDSGGGTDIYSGDIDGNGRKDFVLAGLFVKRVSWFEYSTDNQRWSENIIDDKIVFPGDVSLDDLDGDGDLDVVLAGMGTNQMIWYENNIAKKTGK